MLDFDSSSAILKIEWREEDLGFTAHVQPFLNPVKSCIDSGILYFKDGNGLDWTGLVKRGLAKRGLVRRGLVKHGLVKRGLAKRGLVKRGLVKRGLVKRRLVKHGLVKHGLVKRSKIFVSIETIICHLKNFSSYLIIKLS